MNEGPKMVLVVYCSFPSELEFSLDIAWIKSEMDVKCDSSESQLLQLNLITIWLLAIWKNWKIV